MSFMNSEIRKVIRECPVCGDDLVITHLRCPGCETEIRGAFQTSVFCKLSPEDLAFAEMFIKLRGNVKEMERELGVAYNAVRNQLDQVIGNLGFDSRNLGLDSRDLDSSSEPDVKENPEQADAARRRAILGQLDRGEVSADEAVHLLSGGSPTNEETRDE